MASMNLKLELMIFVTQIFTDKAELVFDPLTYVLT